jgi:hypothetical protein
VVDSIQMPPPARDPPGTVTLAECEICTRQEHARRSREVASARRSHRRLALRPAAPPNKRSAPAVNTHLCNPGPDSGP